MNGAVFHTSATMTATLAWKPSVVHRIWCPIRALATPSLLKIHRHVEMIECYVVASTERCELPAQGVGARESIRSIGNE